MDSRKRNEQQNATSETRDNSLNDVPNARLVTTGSWREEPSTQLHESTAAAIESGDIQVRRFGEQKDIVGIGVTERRFAILRQSGAAFEFLKSVRPIGRIHIGLVAPNTPAQVEAKMVRVFSGRGNKAKEFSPERMIFRQRSQRTHIASG